MAASLYLLIDPPPPLETSYGIQPYDDKYWNDYHTLRRKISLKDLGWEEVNHFQRLIKGADLWETFPAVGLTLVDAEFKGGDENQRIDLLYLRNDGGLLPCELKIGGTAKDSHGQLIRYMADLSFQTLGAPVKWASTRAKVPPVQLDGSAPKTVPTASPRGGVGSRHGVEPVGRNEHMNHINEPRKNTPGSRAPQLWVKAAELESGLIVVGSDNRPAGSAWATCREVTLG